MAIFVCEPVGLLFVGIAKCGSTTMFQLMLRMSGIESDSADPRRLAHRPAIQKQLFENGFRIIHRERRALPEILAAYPGYLVVANIRNPYHRVLSSYFDKLKRYTKAFDRPVFYYGKMRQLLEGPSGWRDGQRSIEYMQRRISFENLVDGLARHGVNFDSHYNLQSKLLELGDVNYDALFHLENLQEEFIDGLRRFGIDGEFIDRVGAIPRKNRSQYSHNRDEYLTPQVKDRIYEIYRKDFEALDYPR